MLDVAIVGAGLSGLTAACQLEKKGYKVAVFEASGQIGGRCKTEYMDGYVLDKGLHFFQKGYSESKKLLDFRSLRLESVYPGALVHYNNNFHLMTNPLRRLSDVLSTAIAPISTLRDKFKMVTFLTQLSAFPEKVIFSMPDQDTATFLKEKGFSDIFINAFFRPFVKAVFYDNSMQVSSRLFCYMLKVFASEDNALPANGISSIPVQLAAQLKKDTVRLHSKIVEIHEDGLELADGEIIEAKKIILAVPPHQLEKLLPGYQSKTKFLPISTIYFASNTPPVKQPVILLNGDEKGIVSSVFVPTTVQPSYAPAGRHLIAVTLHDTPVLHDEELVDAVLAEMINWFGVQVNDWVHLKTFHIKHALPFKTELPSREYTFSKDNNIFLCGDHLSFGSVDSALRSGRETADEVEKALKVRGKEYPRKPVTAA
jgi:phytoene dehydrogenase-like protein